ncbi:TetR/AcrR family transcriptional regulator [Oligoflexaceae bacterium]|nr:TetR/AcrR family transcriptional regulator [Oligoflexaceae bacterium]
MKQKKQLILETAISSIEKYGVIATNAQLIAKELGIAQSTVFYHFPKQKQLFEELFSFIVRYNQSEVQKRLDKNRSSKNLIKLTSYLEGNLDWAFAHRDHVVVLLNSVVESTHNEVLKGQLDYIFNNGEEKIYNILTAGIIENEFTLSQKAKPLARSIHKFLIGTIISTVFDNHKKAKTIEFVKDHVRKLIVEVSE